MNARPNSGERRTLFAWTVALGLLLFCFVPVFLWSRTNHSNGVQTSSGGSRAHRPADTAGWSPGKSGEPLLRDPVWVYNNGSSSDERSDNIPLTEELAMKELDEMIRLRKFGVHFDYYMRDAFWFAPDGGYRTWRKPNWPNGPDNWIAACKKNGILPGMWSGTNAPVHINGAPQWKDSTTFYVDSRGGNDANTGRSPAAAWKTLDKINATTFEPGDRILLKSSSVFRGQLWPKGSGTAGHPVQVDMYGGGVKPVINGDGLFEDAVLLKNQENWDIANLEITNTGAQRAERRGVHIALENYGEAHHIYLRSLTIHDVNGVDDLKPNGGISYTSTSQSKPSRFVDLRIENNEIYHVDRSGIFGWSDAWVRSKWNPSLGVVVRGNFLYDIGGDGIVVVATDGAIVENNVVGRANQRSQGYNVAIWAWSADNTLIQNNEAYGTKGQRDGEGFDSDWNSRNTVIQYNYSHDNDGGFLLICNEGGHDPTESAGNAGTIIRYNISQNDRTRGINVAGPVKDSAIYNNTIYVGAEHGVSLLLFSDWHGWSENTRLYNNIFYVSGKGEFTYGISRATDGDYETASGFGPSIENILDANIYFGVTPPTADPQALTVDPKLAAPGTGGFGRLTLAGYRLQVGSSARRTGKYIQNSGGRDFWGNAVPSCKQTDRGAVQSDDCAAHK